MSLTAKIDTGRVLRPAKLRRGRTTPAMALREAQDRIAHLVPLQVSLVDELIAERRAEAGGNMKVEPVLDANIKLRFIR